MAAKKKKIEKDKKKPAVVETVAESKLSKKEQEKTHDKILKGFLIGGVILILIIVSVVYAVKSSKRFEYRGVDFEIVKTGSLVLYNTKIPVIIDGKERDYNFYLRTDPRTLDKNVSFEGNLSLAENLVLNSTEDFNCDGYGVIGIANLVNLYRVSGIEVIRDGTANCDPQGRYAFINLEKGNETSIKEIGPSCYQVQINNCEILGATEKLMLESFVKINELI